jgi:hypothetical protein
MLAAPEQPVSKRAKSEELNCFGRRYLAATPTTSQTHSTGQYSKTTTKMTDET